jgi:hypothetical protein
MDVAAIIGATVLGYLAWDDARAVVGAALAAEPTTRGPGCRFRTADVIAGLSLGGGAKD